jgi:hypothetical protein
MDVRTAIEIGIYSGLIPAAAALVLCSLLGRLLPDGIAARYRLAAAFALAVFVGFAAGPQRKSFIPEEFWDWVPYLGVLAAIVAGAARANRISHIARWVMIAVVAALAAWLVVPTWEDLAPPRPVHLAAVAVGIAALALLLEPLSKRLPGRAFPWWLMVTAGACALLILAEVSETFGRLAALPASALVGCLLAAWLTTAAADWGSLALPYAVVVGGYTYTSAIYPSPPLVPLVFAPFAPLGLWICTCGPLGRLTGVRAAAAQAVCVILPLATITALLLVLARNSDDVW